MNICSLKLKKEPLFNEKRNTDDINNIISASLKSKQNPEKLAVHSYSAFHTTSQWLTVDLYKFLKSNE